ncbi:MAG: hypothetical protein ABIJ09_27430 [Pseudomonadota bacterium]
MKRYRVERSCARPVLLAVVTLCTLASGCEQASSEATPSVEPAPSHLAPLDPPTTALLVVNLSPEGGVTIAEARVRPTPFRLASAASPRHPGLTLAAGVPSLHGPATTVHPDTGVPPPPTNSQIPVPPGALQTDACSLVVEHPQRPQPVVLPLDLGAPGEGGGDVRDRWQDGSVILRAPFFGPGTHYSIVRGEAASTRVLASHKVQP